MARVSRYITLDIVVKTNGDCDSIAKAFNESAGYFVQKHQWNDYKWYLNISGGGAGNASEAIEKHCRYIAAFEGPAKEAWDAAEVKEFFIGYEGGESPTCFDSHISAQGIAMAAQLGAGIGIAIYPATEEEHN